MADGHTHHIRPEDWPADEYVAKASGGKVGMWLFLLSDMMMFAGFLLAYGIRRGSSEIWQCTEAAVEKGLCVIPEPSLGINFTALLTFLLICSSVSMVMAYAAVVEKDRKKALFWLGLTIFGGALFLVGQYHEYWGVVGGGLIGNGLHFGQSDYATTFYCITAFHGMHVFSGVVYLSFMWVRLKRGKYDDGDYNHIEMVGLFWHFVDLVWILVFTFVYLVPDNPVM